MDDFKRPKPAAVAKTKPEVQAVDVDSDDELEKPIVLDDQPAKEAVSKTDKTGGNFLSHRFNKVKTWWKSLNRNLRFGIIALALLIICAGGLLAYSSSKPKIAPATQITKHTPKSQTVASPLTGVQVTKQAASRPVTGVMIENSLDARPQSGLQDAGVVYEAVAEAGITRFLTLFQDTAPQYLGPVRSLRPYYIDYAAPFQASIVHVGGSPDALSEVQNGSFRNLDQFFNGAYFTRISSRDAPHNVYTSFAELDQLNQSKGYTSSKFTSWPRKKDAKLTVPTAKTIDMAVSGPSYYVHYDYDAKTNSYARSEAGAPHMELTNSSDTVGVQIKPKVVVALVVPLSQGALDASGAYYSDYSTSGSGIAYVFQDGGVTQGTWTKDGTDGQLQFTDAAGHELKLNAGQTWLTLTSDTSQVTYSK